MDSHQHLISLLGSGLDTLKRHLHFPKHVPPPSPPRAPSLFFHFCPAPLPPPLSKPPPCSPVAFFWFLCCHICSQGQPKQVTLLLKLCTGLWLLSPGPPEPYSGLLPSLSARLASFHLLQQARFFAASRPLHFALPRSVTLIPVLFITALFLLTIS